MKPVLEKTGELDIATNPAGEALFEAGNAGFQIWCTPDDHPAGWEGVPMDAGAFSKPCAYVASVRWGWEGERITHLVLSTDAYALRDQCTGDPHKFHNRIADLAWAERVIHRLFEMAGVPIPRISIET